MSTMSATIIDTPRQTMPRMLLRLEGLVYLVASVVAYAYLGHSWLLLALLLFSPDVMMLGYLHSPRVGALAYNLAHTSGLPLLLGLAGLLLSSPLGMQLALIWLAHIGMDRAMGYGLKYPDAFTHTHMGEV